jgi:integrase/recombinase XerD
MAKLKLVLDQRRPSSSGLYPLKFRVTHQTKSAEISTNIKASPLEFDDRRECLIKKPDQNDLLFAQRKLFEQRLEAIHPDLLSSMSVIELRDALLQKTKKEFTIESFWKDEIDRLVLCNRLGGARVYQLSLSAVGKVLNLNIPFSQLSYRDIDLLESKLSKSGLKTNSVGVHMRSLKAICNKAMKQDLVDFSWYPFRKYTIRREKTVPRVLTLEEVQRYFNLNIQPVGAKYKYWCIGKLLFMLRGINIRDLINLKPSNIKNGRIIYKRAKTGKVYSIYLTNEMQHIFDQFQDGHTLLSIISKEEMETKNLVQIYHQRSKIMNKHLRHFGKLIQSSEEITTYVFRYSYANIAKQLGYSKDLIAEALGHEYGNKVTGIYLEQFDHGIIDQMNSNIIQVVQQAENAPF